MLKVITELEKLGLELTDEMKESIKKNIGEEVYSKSELDKKVKKVEEERDQYKGRAETAEETLKGFDGKDLETITKERDEWKEKAETAANEYKQKLEERDYKDAVDAAVKDLKFSSNSAKKAFVSDLMSDKLKMKNGMLVGFNDFVDAYKKEDATAFVDDVSVRIDSMRQDYEQQKHDDDNSAQFTDHMTHQQQGTEPITGDPNKMDFATYKKWRAQNK